MQHMGPAGLVLQSSFNQSKIAAASAQEMIGKLPTSLQKLAKEYAAGTLSQKDWTAGLKGQPALVTNLATQFMRTEKQAAGFSSQLRAGGGSAETFNAAMANMTGGSTGLAASLALTGDHMTEFRGNVKTIGGAAVEAGGHVKGWGDYAEGPVCADGTGHRSHGSYRGKNRHNVDPDRERRDSSVREVY